MAINRTQELADENARLRREIEHYKGIGEHLRNHLTDGRWHDDCVYCKRRRIEGGTGVWPSEL